MSDDPPPAQMLFEGAVDTVASLKLMRLGAIANRPMGEALTIIETAIDQLEYAISAALDAKVSA
jgi:hypothetical protein